MQRIALAVLILAIGCDNASEIVRPATGRPFRVNTYVTGEQYDPDVAALPGGLGFLVVWAGQGGQGGTQGIFGRRLNGNGEPVGDELAVSSFTSGRHVSPRVTVLDDDRFLVVWSGSAPQSPDFDIYARLFEADAVPRGTEFRVNEYTTRDQRTPSVVATHDGGFIVAWSGNYAAIDVTNPNKPQRLIATRRYLADGTPGGPELQVGEIMLNAYRETVQETPEIAGTDDGDFVVVWASDGPYAPYPINDVHIQGRALDADGVPTDDVTTIAESEDANFLPSLVAASDGGFIVSWVGCRDSAVWKCAPDTARVFLTTLDASARATRDPVLPGTESFTVERRPRIVRHANGGFVLAWPASFEPLDRDDGTQPKEAFVRRLDTAGFPLGSILRLGPTADAYASGPSVASDADGGVLVTWATPSTSHRPGDVVCRYLAPSEFGADTGTAPW
jgi:hypothetical protein